MKRGADLIISALGLILLSPLWIGLAVLIKFYDGGPVFFIQRRVGWRGHSFHMWKFRTMVVDADKKGASLTIGHDQRITPLEHLLRRFKLDEFPQLWNVFMGDMSLVGPRPEIEKYVALYTQAQREVLELHPGITDPASFAFFDESKVLGEVADPERYYRDVLIPEKIRINLEYARRASLGGDLVLIGATIARAFGFKFDIFSWLKIELPQIASHPEK